MVLKKNVPVININQLRVMVYGPPKVGKSSFAVCNPKALIMDADNEGTQFLDCFRISCTSWKEFKIDLNNALTDEENDFDTVVLDTVDGFWNLCRQHVCEENGIKHESDDKGFGRMWDFVKTEWMKLINYINGKGKGIWFISHAVEKEKKIDGMPRTVVTPSLPGGAAKNIMAMCDEIFYIDQNEDDKRVLHVMPQTGIECGGRLAGFGLDEDIEFDTEQEAYNEVIRVLEENNKPATKAKGKKK